MPSNRRSRSVRTAAGAFAMCAALAASATPAMAEPGADYPPPTTTKIGDTPADFPQPVAPSGVPASRAWRHARGLARRQPRAELRAADHQRRPPRANDRPQDRPAAPDGARGRGAASRPRGSFSRRDRAALGPPRDRPGLRSHAGRGADGRPPPARPVPGAAEPHTAQLNHARRPHRPTHGAPRRDHPPARRASPHRPGDAPLLSHEGAAPFLRIAGAPIHARDAWASGRARRPSPPEATGAGSGGPPLVGCKTATAGDQANVSLSRSRRPDERSASRCRGSSAVAGHNAGVRRRTPAPQQEQPLSRRPAHGRGDRRGDARRGSSAHGRRLRGLIVVLLPPPPSVRPPKTERPHRIPRHTPNHHVTNPPHDDTEDRDKPGRPRATHPAPRPRPRAAKRETSTTNNTIAR